MAEATELQAHTWVTAAGVVGFAAAGKCAFPEQHRGAVQSIAASAAALAACSATAPDTFCFLVNPLQLSAMQMLLAWVVMRAALMVANPLLEWCVGRVAKRYRPEQLGRYAPEFFDGFVLFLNSGVEMVMLMHMYRWLSTDAEVVWKLSGLGLANTLLAAWMALVVNDVIYAPAHYLMHHHAIYPYIHKHHHRVVYPHRFYIDAANEHPIEQVIGLSILFGTLWLVSRGPGLHIVTVVVHFTLYSVMQISNHGPYDLRFNVLGIAYCSGDHEMHHRVPSCNMAQYCMWVDKLLLGTYRPYAAPSKAE
eukprot:TRINITY_DN6635_c0_g1_i1.p1 TRINITY_DN6635_c0_g1~~TRINITY_DN6635_c0_g1_i1.p1  ORF type:complete len:307 (+),score=53.37 TRINITY_DN6635_c0_g1_i1:87-1007(+)